jgi:hypothetical protein
MKQANPRRSRRLPGPGRVAFITLIVIAAIVGGTAPWSGLSAMLTSRVSPSARQLARLEPQSGTLYGVNLDWEHDTAAGYSQRFGRSAAVYVVFARFPIPPEADAYLDAVIGQVQQQRALALLTLEPAIPLQEVSPEMATAFAERLAGYNARGVAVLVRFAHEMNGSWYSWGQQPTTYIRAFRLLAEAVHQLAPNSAMLWAPNYGAGYPFTGGAYSAQPGSSDFAVLDTNHDGVLDARDDPYAPYYPGDDAVDWVGMTLYHWGDVWPWGKNIVPEPGKFAAQLTGSYNGANGDERTVPDFYGGYAVGHGKPMAVPETAALFNTSVDGGDAELDVKRAWWRQVFSTETARAFPDIKMINWFEWRKPESELGGAVVDWTATLDPIIRVPFVADLAIDQQLLFAGGPPPIPPEAAVAEPAQGVPTTTASAAVASDFRRAIQFSGYEWRVRSASELEGPGPNYFSDSADNVWIDADGRLHLRIAPAPDGRWVSTEVALDGSLGYGTYQFDLASRVDRLDPNVAFGLFTWSDDPAENHRELDIEFAAFGKPSQLTGRYTLQPYTNPDNVYLFQPPAASTSTYGFAWTPQHLEFQSSVDSSGSTGPGEAVAVHAFDSGVPEPGPERVHINAWLDAGRPPTDGQPVEFVVRGFTFTPQR